jgi:hypothetical protein
VLATLVAGTNRFPHRSAVLVFLGVMALIAGIITVVRAHQTVEMRSGEQLPLVPYTSDLRNLDLRQWCLSVGAGPTVDPTPAQQRGALGKWRCKDGRQIDWQAACDYFYPPAGSTTPVAITHDDSAGGRCRDNSRRGSRPPQSLSGRAREGIGTPPLRAGHRYRVCTTIPRAKQLASKPEGAMDIELGAVQVCTLMTWATRRCPAQTRLDLHRRDGLAQLRRYGAWHGGEPYPESAALSVTLLVQANQPVALERDCLRHGAVLLSKMLWRRFRGSR